MEKGNSCSYLRTANKLGLFFFILFVICFIWFWIWPAERELHLALLKLSFMGYSGMNPLSFILGAVQSYIWAYIFVGIWWIISCSWKKDK
jgi:hypothetical protein